MRANLSVTFTFVVMYVPTYVAASDTIMCITAALDCPALLSLASVFFLQFLLNL